MSSPITNAEVFRTIKDKQDDLVIAATDIAVILYPYGTDPGPIVDDSTGKLLPLVDGAFSLGEIQKAAGVNLSPEMSTEGIMGYGSRSQRRIFVTDESFSLDLTVQELRAKAWQAFYSVDDADITNSEFATRMVKRETTQVPEFTMVMIAKDLLRTGELFPFWVFPKVVITQKGQISLTENAEIGTPMTFTVMSDDTGEQFEIGLGGPAWPSLVEKAGFK